MEWPALDEATVEDIARGAQQNGEGWQCLLCGESFENGMIYLLDGKMYEAGRAVFEHIRAEHGSSFRVLLRERREQIGLTERQASALELMAAGRGDKEIAETLSGSDNTASIRNLRFQLKEREREARLFLALMEAFRREKPGKPASKNAVSPLTRGGASLADERFDATERERQAVLKAYFTVDGLLKEFPVREKRKIIALREIARRFQAGRSYTEKEVNAIIDYHDYATVRRYLIEYELLERTADCTQYHLKEKKNDADSQLSE